MIANSERNIYTITYDHRNLAQEITTSTGHHRYIYNHEGTRIGKQYRQDSEQNWTVNTRYVYGAYGELLAQYSGTTLKYWNILAGSEAIGRSQPVKSIFGNPDRFYYLKDHLGSVRVTVAEDGNIAGWDDYYPFGLQMPGREDNSDNDFDDQKFTGHFLEQEGNLGIYHAGARLYDPEVPRFYGVDAMRGMYPGLSSYVYAANNPVIFIDPDGNHIVVARNDDGTFTVVDGELNEDTSIYIQVNGEGPMDILAQMITTHSFFDEGGNVVTGAIIDMGSTEGQNFLDDEIIAANPSLLSYIFSEDGGRSGKTLDFKDRGVTDTMRDEQVEQHRYRGSVTSDGEVGSARDFGNIGAGIVAGRHGLNWRQSRVGFDGYQMFTDIRNLRKPSVEGATSQKAQKIGHGMGVQLRPNRPTSTIMPRLVP